MKPVIDASGAKMAPKVSILIPTHNRPDYFEIALSSALAQTYSNIEIIISDNSDDDRTMAKIPGYQATHPQLVYLRTRNTIGLQNFFNAHRLATGDYIAYLMDDDAFHPEKVERMVRYFEASPNIGLVTSFRRLIDGAGNFLPQMPGTEKLFESDTFISGTSFGKHILQQGSNVIGEPTTAMFRRKDAPLGIGWFQEKQYRLLTDVASWLSILAHSDCVYISDALSYFRLHDSQDQKTSNNVRLRASIEWMNLLLDAEEVGSFFVDENEYLELLTLKMESLKAYIANTDIRIQNDEQITQDLASIISRTEQRLGLLE